MEVALPVSNPHKEAYIVRTSFLPPPLFPLSFQSKLTPTPFFQPQNRPKASTTSNSLPRPAMGLGGHGIPFVPWGTTFNRPSAASWQLEHQLDNDVPPARRGLGHERLPRFVSNGAQVCKDCSMLVWVTAGYSAGLGPVDLYEHNLNNGKASFFFSFYCRSLRPSLISEHERALNSYLEDMALNKTLRDAMGVKWLDFVVRPKLLMSWFEGNCNTTSKREEYAQKLGQYVHLESYGSCGKFTCKMWGYQDDVDGCWKKYMATKYLFALVMEDYLCDHYTTQGLYRVLENGLVPIVWGGESREMFFCLNWFLGRLHWHDCSLGWIFVWTDWNKVLNYSMFTARCSCRLTWYFCGLTQWMFEWKTRFLNDSLLL